jgi:adenylyltransferase/sulfurtransferase
VSKNLDRYSRQTLFPGIGREGQQRLLDSRVLLCGCGALGTVLAETLTRAGVGFLRVIDRDFVEESNLQRQVLFDENDVVQRIPKAIAAAEKLRAINSDVEIEPHVADIDHNNILRFADSVDLILDGTDNFDIRFLINDVSLETGIPWVYAGCIGSHGQSMAVFPNERACLRCLMEAPPEPGTAETCDTAGILGPTVNVIASLQAVDALKILSGHRDAVAAVLTVIDVWDGTFRRMSVADLRERSDCKACLHGERLWLRGHVGAQTSILCGRNAVQVTPPGRAGVDLDQLEQKLAGLGTVSKNPFLLRLVLTDPDYDLTVFRDGRLIVKGTDDIGIAKALYARYIGA